MTRKNLRKIRTFLFVSKHKYITTRYNNDLLFLHKNKKTYQYVISWPHVRPITLFYKEKSLPQGHVSVISSNTPYKYNNARFITVPLKPINEQLCGRYCRFQVEKFLILKVPFFPVIEISEPFFKEKLQLKII